MFPNLTVLENLKIGAYLRKDKDGIEKDIQWVYRPVPTAAGAVTGSRRAPSPAASSRCWLWGGP